VFGGKTLLLLLDNDDDDDDDDDGDSGSDASISLINRITTSQPLCLVSGRYDRLTRQPT